MMNSAFNLSPKNMALMGVHWGWFFFFGLALMVLGLIAISAATFATEISIMLLGTLLTLGGVVILLDTFRSWWKKWTVFTFHFLLAILYILAGFYLFNDPVIWSISLTLVIGIAYAIIGIFRLISATIWRTTRWGWGFFNGLVTFLLGILILNNWPESGLFMIGLFIGIDLFIAGWVYLMIGLAAKSMAK